MICLPLTMLLFSGPTLIRSHTLSAEVSPRIVSEQLGHALVVYTLEVYSHLLPHMPDTVVIKIEALLMAP